MSGRIPSRVPSRAPSRNPSHGPTRSRSRRASQGPPVATRDAQKKLIVCCDGTWLNSDSGITKSGIFDNGRVQVPSNVTRMCRSIKAESRDGATQQIVYYQAGVGTGTSWWDRIVGGATGLGLSEHMREAYGFLANNYMEGDQIIIMGFSRGAFTARSIAGLISSIGLLTKRGLDSFYEIFKDYENSWDPRYVPRYPNVPFKNKPNIKDPAYAAGLESRGLSRLNIPIKAVAVWDTVGSLGLPNIAWLERMGIRAQNREYSFYDTKLSANIQYAFQALALDEQRTPFSPAVWEKPRGVHTKLKQCWFPGAHSNIGGGYEDAELANITLAWMMSQLDPFIEFDSEFIRHQWVLNQKYYKSLNMKPRSWGRGKVYNSMTGIESLAGRTDRTPGLYNRPDPVTGARTSTPLERTHESIHASVRLRLGVRGLGTNDRGPYDPHSLRDWRLVGGEGRNGHIATQGQAAVRWEYVGKEEGVKPLPEDELGYWERELLAFDPDVFEKVTGEQLPSDYDSTEGA